MKQIQHNDNDAKNFQDRKELEKQPPLHAGTHTTTQ